jgi:hypothetical protein
MATEKPNPAGVTPAVSKAVSDAVSEAIPQSVAAAISQAVPLEVNLHMSGIFTSIAELTLLTKELTTAQGDQLKKLQRISFRTIIALISIGVLAACIGIATYFIYAATVKLDKQSFEILKLQQTSSVQVLCPLYSVLLSLYDPSSPTAVKDPKKYEDTYTLIENEAKAPGCTHVTRGKLPQ